MIADDNNWWTTMPNLWKDIRNPAPIKKKDENKAHTSLSGKKNKKMKTKTTRHFQAKKKMKTKTTRHFQAKKKKRWKQSPHVTFR